MGHDLEHDVVLGPARVFRVVRSSHPIRRLHLEQAPPALQVRAGPQDFELLQEDRLQDLVLS